MNRARHRICAVSAARRHIGGTGGHRWQRRAASTPPSRAGGPGPWRGPGLLLRRLGGWGAILAAHAGCAAVRWGGGDDVVSPRVNGGENAVTAGEVLARQCAAGGSVFEQRAAARLRRDEGGELGQKIDGCTYHARGTGWGRALELILDLAARSPGQALEGKGRTEPITAQAGVYRLGPSRSFL